MGENDSIMYRHRYPTTTVPLFLHKYSLRIRADPVVHHVSPVMEDDMPVRLSGQSPLSLLDRRVDELALPRHGTKLDKWTRVEKRENEFIEGAKNRKRRLIQNGKLDWKDVDVKLQSRSLTHMNRRSQRRKFTSSLICHHSHGANIASDQNVRRILTSG